MQVTMAVKRSFRACQTASADWIVGEHLAQLGLENLSGGVARQAGKNDDVARQLVIRQTLAEELRSMARVQRDALAGGNKGQRLLALARVWARR